MKNFIKSYEQVQEELENIVNESKIVRKEEPIGYTQIEGLPIPYYTIGNGNKHIIIESGMHGCEIISVDFVLKLMKEMGKEKGGFSFLDFSRYQIHFLPLMNPEGYIIATSAIEKIFTQEMDAKEAEKICKNYYIRYRQDDIDSKKVMKEIEEIEDSKRKEEAISQLRKGVKYYQEMFQDVDATCISERYSKLRKNVANICEDNKIPTGCMQIWSANGNGIDLAQNCEENEQLEEEYGELRYSNINQGRPGPIGCSKKDGKFELEKENIALYQLIDEIEKKKENRIFAYFSYHSTGGMIFYRISEEKQKTEEEKYNESLAIEYAKKTGYSLIDTVRKTECNEIKMRKKVHGHLLIELSKMGGNPIAPYGDLENNYYPTIEKNLKAVGEVLRKIMELN